MKKAFLIISLLFIIFLEACSSVDQGYVEFVSKKFVEEKVRFFSKSGQRVIDLPTYNISSINSYKEGRYWVVNMHVLARLGNETKENSVILKINGKGNVVEFNGNKVK